METWCVCGRESDRDPWEPAVAGLASRDEAERWLRQNHRLHPEYVAWYIDREDNDGTADTYYDRNPDGSLAEYQGSGKVHFAD